MLEMKSFEFAGHVLDLRRGRLRKRGADVALRRKSFSLLAYLIQNSGRVLGKDELVAAIWPDVMVSDDSLAQCVKDIRRALGPEARALIRTIPRRGYIVDDIEVRSLGDEHSASAESVSPPRFEKPSIAVLHFPDLSDIQGQGQIGDGLAQEIVTALSKLNWLSVLAYNSGPTYHGVDVRQIGRELGVRYLLQGCVRKDVSRVRVYIQLVDTLFAMTLWAGRFEGALSNVFELQDRISESVAGLVPLRLEQAEIARAMQKQTASLDAYDYYLRGVACAHEWTEEANGEALSYFDRAIELDPNFASAYGMAARCYVQRTSGGWITDHGQAREQTERLARRAVELGKDDAVALATAGFALAEFGHLRDGAAFIEEALVLNPHLAWAWLFSGWVRIYLGEPDAAIKRVVRAMRLGPRDPQFFCMHGAIACAHIVAGRFAEAMQSAEAPMREHPNFLMANCIAATSAALAGRLEEAQRAMVRLRQINPELSISNVSSVIGAYLRAQDFAKWAHGLRKAGLPE
jgi:TolB-like protein